MVTTPPTSKESEDHFRQHFPKSSDLTLIVLKGHLLIEEAVNSFISNLMPNPDALKATRLDCFQRIRLLRALLPMRDFYGDLDAVEKLNTLRNKFAHNLNPAQIEDQIEIFVRLFEDPEIPIAEFQREPLDHRLKRSIGFLCGQLYGIQKGYVSVQAVRREKND
ncbi:MAG: hypothetical protein P4M00_09400 [Azospirillaceae bacterium]|nr:hypothetical protein [Azospirillaceae bacterium]